jgi:hypothetical protein
MSRPSLDPSRLVVDLEGDLDVGLGPAASGTP